MRPDSVPATQLSPVVIGRIRAFHEAGHSVAHLEKLVGFGEAGRADEGRKSTENPRIMLLGQCRAVPEG